MRPLVAGLILAVAGAGWLCSPWGQSSEETIGLSLLFKLRGPRRAPEKALIVNIDRDSDEVLDVSDRLETVPRSVHARLVEALNRHGASVIVFDLFFSEEKDRREDLAFAEAIGHAGNVILVEDLQRTIIAPAETGEQAAPVSVEQLIPPIPALAGAALALAPFPLPKVPVRISQCWHFKASSSDVPTLPIVAFQAANLDSYETIRAMIGQRLPAAAAPLPPSARQAVSSPGLTETMRMLYHLFRQHGELGPELLAAIDARPPGEKHAAVRALISLYAGENCSYIDFYGPPATLATMSYREVLAAGDSAFEAPDPRINKRVVFIGAARRTWSNQEDGFYTAFSQPDGLDLSGVELAATVFSNLYENRSVTRTSWPTNLTLICIAAVGACLLSSFLPPVQAGAALLALGAAGLFGARALFAASGIWPPLLLLIALLPPAAFGLMTLLNYLTAQRERQHVSTALGFYLPHEVVRELSRDLSFISEGDKMVYSVCLVSDAQHYTALSERLEPAALSGLMKEYFEYLFSEVNRRRGFVCNTIGDSMLALWPSVRPEVSSRRNACRAALQIVEAVALFNKRHPATPLPTRIGLHSGTLLLGNIGAADHYEYAPVGDTVNTASRLEGLNKRLDTRILASDETIRDIAGIVSQEIGVFLLGGKSNPVRIHELFTAEQAADPTFFNYLECMKEALGLFGNARWRRAAARFQEAVALRPDGPARYYHRLCSVYEQTPPEEWDGVIRVDK